MKHSISSSDGMSIKLKTRTNQSHMNSYDKRQQNIKINLENQTSSIQPFTDHSTQNKHYFSPFNKFRYHHNQLNHQNKLQNKEKQQLKGRSRLNKYEQQQKYISSHPLSPNSKRLQQQLSLFRFEQKIQQIQQQQIQKLIQQQIKSYQTKQISYIKQLLNKTPIHPNHSNAFRLYKHTSYKPSKGHKYNEINKNRDKLGINKSEMNNYNKMTNMFENNKIVQSIRKESTLYQGNNTMNKTDHYIVINQINTNQQPQKASKNNKTSKTNSQLPVWQRNLFHQKLLLRQNRSKQSLSKTFYSSTTNNKTFYSSNNNKSLLSNKTNKSFFTNHIENNQVKSLKKLKQIKQQLNILKNKSLSITKNYQYYIKKYDRLNPQIQKELIKQLQQSKQNQKLLLDSNNKSFSGYTKVKSSLYNKNIIQAKNNYMNHIDQKEQQDQQKLYNLASYKINSIKPLKFKLSSKNNNQLLLFNQQSYPKLNRYRNYHDQEQNDQVNSQQGSQNDQQITIKFKRKYKEKNNQSQIQKFIKQRNQKSRQASSPYHQLSAWN